MLFAALVSCSVVLEADDTYFAVCEGREALMGHEVVQMIEKDHMVAFCVPYTYEQIGDTISFVVVCE